MISLNSRNQVKVLLFYILTFCLLKAEPVEVEETESITLFLFTGKEVVVLNYDRVDAIKWVRLKSSKNFKTSHELRMSLLSALDTIDITRIHKNKAASLNTLLSKLATKSKNSIEAEMGASVTILMNKSVLQYNDDNFISEVKKIITDESP